MTNLLIKSERSASRASKRIVGDVQHGTIGAQVKAAPLAHLERFLRKDAPLNHDSPPPGCQVDEFIRMDLRYLADSPGMTDKRPWLPPAKSGILD